MDKTEQKSLERSLQMHDLEKHFSPDRQVTMCEVLPTKMATRRVELEWERPVRNVEVSPRVYSYGHFSELSGESPTEASGGLRRFTAFQTPDTNLFSGGELRLT